MKHFRILVLTVILLLSVSVIAVVAQESCAADTGVTITLAGWSSNPAEDAALQAQLDLFGCETGVTAQFVPSTDHTVTMQTAFASGDYPEVFYIDSSLLLDWVEASVVAPGDDYIEDQEGFYPSLMDIFTVDGVLYCPPKDFSTMALQYNKDLFDAASLAYPTPDWTWDDLYTAAEALTDPEAGVVGLVTPPNLERWMPFMYQSGGQIFDEFGTFAFDSEETLAALDYYISFTSDGIGGPHTVVDAGWGGEAFGTGRAAMAMEGNWVIQYLLDNYPEINWGVTELPTGEAGQATMAFTVCYGVGAANDYPEESWALVNFLTGEEGALAVAEASFGPMPTRMSAADAYLTSWATRTEGANVNAADFQAFVTGADYAYPWILPVGWGSFKDAFNSALQEAFDGQKTPEEVLAGSVAAADELMAEQ